MGLPEKLLEAERIQELARPIISDAKKSLEGKDPQIDENRITVFKLIADAVDKQPELTITERNLLREYVRDSLYRADEADKLLSDRLNPPKIRYIGPPNLIPALFLSAVCIAVVIIAIALDYHWLSPEHRQHGRFRGSFLAALFAAPALFAATYYLCVAIDRIRGRQPKPFLDYLGESHEGPGSRSCAFPQVLGVKLGTAVGWIAVLIAAIASFVYGVHR